MNRSLPAAATRPWPLVTDAHPFDVTPEHVARFTAATLDDVPFYEATGTVPPVFGVVAAWPATLALLGAAVAPDDLLASLHLRQDMHLYRLLRVGERVTCVAETLGLRGTARGSTLSYLMTTSDATGAVVTRTYSTILLRTMTERVAQGGEVPDVPAPPTRTSVERGRVDFDLPADITRRFAAASGDELPVHVDEDVAQRAGFEGVIVHGMCTLAMCAAAVGRVAAGGDMARLRRIAVTFARPLYPARPMTVTVTGDAPDTAGAGAGAGAADPAIVAFGARQDDRRATRSGVAVVGPE